MEGYIKVATRTSLTFKLWSCRKKSQVVSKFYPYKYR